MASPFVSTCPVHKIERPSGAHIARTYQGLVDKRDVIAGKAA